MTAPLPRDPALVPHDAAPMSLDLARHTGFLVRRTQQAHLAAWAQEVGTRLTNIQFGVLNVLHGLGQASQRELCDALDLDRSTVAGLVARLESRGLVARVRADADRRRNVVQLTDAGRDTLRDLAPAAARVDDVLTATLTPGERETLQVLLTKVLQVEETGPPRHPQSLSSLSDRGPSPRAPRGSA